MYAYACVCVFFFFLGGCFKATLQFRFPTQDFMTHNLRGISRHRIELLDVSCDQFVGGWNIRDRLRSTGFFFSTNH
ncbi:hypothetical protein PF011_g18050 [Phytophthora fragariae]|uniref:Uncharacterized protein n=1 Tax=Phytophthora fragariae TaxID=53985 RepID=A0A6A3JFD2_9STRA|nr:hypothetical protein PF011_g18050 [Phytophthora fragariae]